jgi:hypothetical protein
MGAGEGARVLRGDGLGGAAGKAANLVGCKSPRRQLPDSDGEHIRSAGREQTVICADVNATAAQWMSHCGRNDLGGEQTRRPAQERMTDSPEIRPVRKSLYGPWC